MKGTLLLFPFIFLFFFEKILSTHLRERISRSSGGEAEEEREQEPDLGLEPRTLGS